MRNPQKKRSPWATRCLCILALGLMGCGGTLGTSQQTGARGTVRIAPRGTIDNPGRFKALLIANERYENPSVPNLESPVRDVKKLATVLKNDYGFSVSTMENIPTARRMYEVLKHFLMVDVQETDSLLIYFAGHGIKDDVLKTGFWVPTSANATMHDSFRTDDLRALLKMTPARHGLVISDSCFSGRLIRSSGVFSAHRGTYAEAYKKRSFEVLTSGADEPVPDEGADGHSPFAYYLIRHLKNPVKNTFGVNEFVGKMETEIRSLTSTGTVPIYSPTIRGTLGDHGGKFVFFRKTQPAHKPSNRMGRAANYSVRTTGTQTPNITITQEPSTTNDRIQLSLTVLERELGPIELPAIYIVNEIADYTFERHHLPPATDKTLSLAMKDYVKSQKACKAARQENIRAAEAQQKELKEAEAAWKRGQNAGNAVLPWAEASQALRAKQSEVRSKWRAALDATCAKVTRARDAAVQHIMKALPRDHTVKNNVPEWLWVHLAKFRAEQAREAYDDGQEEYYRQLKLFHDGKTNTEPSPPPERTDFGQSLQILDRFLERFKTHPARAWGLYLKAYYLSEMLQPEKANDTYVALIHSFPHHRLAPDVYFRVGEYYFHRGGPSLRSALEYYKAGKQSQKSDIPGFLLYKMAWTSFLLDDVDNAFDLFSEYILRHSANNVNMAAEAIQFTGLITCERQSAQALLDTQLSAEYKAMGLEQAAHCAYDRGDVGNAVVWFKHALRLAPHTKRAFQRDLWALEGLSDLGKSHQLQDRANDLMARYGVNSIWWKTHRKSLKPTFLSQLTTQQNEWTHDARSQQRKPMSSEARFSKEATQLLSGVAKYAITRCRNKIQSSPTGKVQLRVDWNDKGKVTKSDMTLDSCKTPVFSRCIRDDFGRLKNLPQTSGGADIAITIE